MLFLYNCFISKMITAAVLLKGESYNHFRDTSQADKEQLFEIAKTHFWCEASFYSMWFPGNRSFFFFLTTAVAARLFHYQLFA